HVRYRGPAMANHPANLEVIYELYGQWAGLEVDEVNSRMQRNFGRLRDYQSLTSGQPDSE
ncbi:MAG: hypothetical protein AAGF67_01550, partial [Verrucomicrobiota bacterium]